MTRCINELNSSNDSSTFGGLLYALLQSAIICGTKRADLTWVLVEHTCCHNSGRL
jgi:hypothetical protein